MFILSKTGKSRGPRINLLPALAGLYVLLFVVPAQVAGQAPGFEKPVPILSGSAGFFTNVAGGQAELSPQINPVLLLPLGDRWLVESRGEFEGKFQRRPGGGAYGGPVDKHLDYCK